MTGTNPSAFFFLILVFIPYSIDTLCSAATSGGVASQVGNGMSSTRVNNMFAIHVKNPYLSAFPPSLFLSRQSGRMMLQMED